MHLIKDPSHKQKDFNIIIKLEDCWACELDFATGPYKSGEKWQGSKTAIHPKCDFWCWCCEWSPASKSSPVRLEPFSARGLWTCKVRRQQGGQIHQCLKKMSSLSSATSSFTTFAFDFIKIIFTFSTLRSPLHILFFCPHLIILRLHVLPDRWPPLQHFISSDDLQRGRMFIKYHLRIFESQNWNTFFSVT